MVCAASVATAVVAAQSPAPASSADAKAEATAALDRGRAPLHQNHVPQAREAGAVALTLYQQLHDTWGIGAASQLLGEAASRMGDLPAATTHYERALAAFEAIDDPDGRARTLVGLVRVAKRPI